MKDFIDIELSVNNMDKYYIRHSIFNALKASLTSFNGKLLDIGCGKMPYKKYILEHSKVSEYIGLDIQTAIAYDETVKPDYTWDGINMPFESESFDCAFGTEVLEHCPNPEIVLKEVYRVLKPNGVFFFTVPFLWNLHEVPHDEYRYTPFALERHFRNSGFSNITIKPTGGWHASMAQMLGLWVRRSSMMPTKRKMLSKFIIPIMRYLIKRDDTKHVVFREGQMITGLYGMIKK